MNRWLRPFAISLVVHGAVLGSGAFLLGSGDTNPEAPSVFPVSLVVDPRAPGLSGSPGGLGSMAIPTAPPNRAMVATSKPDQATVAPVDTSPRAESPIGVSESTATTGSGTGDGNGSGSGPGGLGNGDGTGGGSVQSVYEPPRLLAGALPLDPDKGVALTVPPEIPVRLRVGADGRVKEIVPEIEHLAPAVLDALHRSADAMRFAPARRGGAPVEGWFSMTFVYRH